ncbi:MAG TPA: hypothetical protein VH475_11945, partial [Tepidisphaeraceae bacterium]
MTALKLSCAFLLLALACSAYAQKVDHTAFDTILKATVKDERVDYNQIKDKYLPQLNAYLDALANVDPAKLDRGE